MFLGLFRSLYEFKKCGEAKMCSWNGFDCVSHALSDDEIDEYLTQKLKNTMGYMREINQYAPALSDTIDHNLKTLIDSVGGLEEPNKQSSFKNGNFGESFGLHNYAKCPLIVPFCKRTACGSSDNKYVYGLTAQIIRKNSLIRKKSLIAFHFF